MIWQRLAQEMSDMKQLFKQSGRLFSVAILLLALSWTQVMAQHDIRGITPDADGEFDLYAFPFFMNLPEGSSLYMWGFGNQFGAGSTHTAGDGFDLPQYPAPTLIVTEGEMYYINLTNAGVPEPVSIVVTGHDVSAECTTPLPDPVPDPTPDPECADGLVIMAADVDQSVRYTFTAPKAGTYVYHSLNGSNPGLHAEMGLQGTLIVRPADPNTAYGADTETDYDQEFLYLLTEIDPDVHLQMERGHYAHFTNSDRAAKIWFVNGRVFPDLFQGDYNDLFPHQPYESLAQAHPGEKVLVRTINAGHDPHPFHFHGENLRFVGRDGRMLSSDGLVADLGRSDNTLNSAPKQAVDMIWTWTGANMGWDIYGHQPGDALEVGEFADDHGKKFPVTLPGAQDLTLGGWWSGSPFLGAEGALPPGEGGLNPHGGYFFVWHSHAEKELTTFDIFPGGSLSAVVVFPHSDANGDPIVIQ